MKKLILILSVIGIMAVNGVAYAHPGRTDHWGCHRCWTNCERWGLSYGEYHCH